jgi:hypothetical protein
MYEDYMIAQIQVSICKIMISVFSYSEYCITQFEWCFMYLPHFSNSKMVASMAPAIQFLRGLGWQIMFEVIINIAQR